MSKKELQIFKLMTVTVVLAGVTPVLATENGGSTYSHGTENTFIGYMPPPGLYALFYSSHDRLTSLRDNNGSRLNTPFNVTVNSLATRAVWVTEKKLLGGDLAWHAVLPLLTINAEIAGRSEKRKGLGDIVVGTGLGYHPSEKVHYSVGLDVTLPTGSYSRNKIANLGRNYWNIEPVFALSYVQDKALNADVKLMYDFNMKNKATNYRSGQELHMDYSVGYAFGNGWITGVGGYLYKQTTNDKRNGIVVPNKKGRAVGIGPSIAYHNGKGFLITAKLQRDYGVRNRARGNSFKMKLSIPL